MTPTPGEERVALYLANHLPTDTPELTQKFSSLKVTLKEPNGTTTVVELAPGEEKWGTAPKGTEVNALMSAIGADQQSATERIRRAREISVDYCGMGEKNPTLKLWKDEESDFVRSHRDEAEGRTAYHGSDGSAGCSFVLDDSTKVGLVDFSAVPFLVVTSHSDDSDEVLESTSDLFYEEPVSDSDDPVNGDAPEEIIALAMIQADALRSLGVGNTLSEYHADDNRSPAEFCGPLARPMKAMHWRSGLFDTDSDLKRFGHGAVLVANFNNADALRTLPQQGDRVGSGRPVLYLEEDGRWIPYHLDGTPVQDLPHRKGSKVCLSLSSTFMLKKQLVEDLETLMAETPWRERRMCPLPDPSFDGNVKNFMMYLTEWDAAGNVYPLQRFTSFYQNFFQEFLPGKSCTNEDIIRNPELQVLHTIAHFTKSYVNSPHILHGASEGTIDRALEPLTSETGNITLPRVLAVRHMGKMLTEFFPGGTAFNNLGQRLLKVVGAVTEPSIEYNRIRRNLARNDFDCEKLKGYYPDERLAYAFCKYEIGFYLIPFIGIPLSLSVGIGNLATGLDPQGNAVSTPGQLAFTSLMIGIDVLSLGMGKAVAGTRHLTKHIRAEEKTAATYADEVAKLGRANPNEIDKLSKIAKTIRVEAANIVDVTRSFGHQTLLVPVAAEAASGGSRLGRIVAYVRSAISQLVSTRADGAKFATYFRDYEVAMQQWTHGPPPEALLVALNQLGVRSSTRELVVNGKQSYAIVIDVARSKVGPALGRTPIVALINRARAAKQKEILAYRTATGEAAGGYVRGGGEIVIPDLATKMFALDAKGVFTNDLSAFRKAVTTSHEVGHVRPNANTARSIVDEETIWFSSGASAHGGSRLNIYDPRAEKYIQDGYRVDEITRYLNQNLRPGVNFLASRGKTLSPAEFAELSKHLQDDVATLIRFVEDAKITLDRAAAVAEGGRKPELLTKLTKQQFLDARDQNVFRMNESTVVASHQAVVDGVNRTIKFPSSFKPIGDPNKMASNALLEANREAAVATAQLLLKNTAAKYDDALKKLLEPVTVNGVEYRLISFDEKFPKANTLFYVNGSTGIVLLSPTASRETIQLAHRRLRTVAGSLSKGHTAY